MLYFSPFVLRSTNLWNIKNFIGIKEKVISLLVMACLTSNKISVKPLKRKCLKKFKGFEFSFVKEFEETFRVSGSFKAILSSVTVSHYMNL